MTLLWEGKVFMVKLILTDVQKLNVTACYLSY